jgi:rhamnosyltransferase
LPPFVSIVYLTYNGGRLFSKSLESVFSQKVNFEFEVIAIDSGSTDGTLTLLKNYPIRVYQIPHDEFNFGLTRNCGFSLARGEILIALSQDAVPVGSDWLHNMVSPFQDTAIAVVQGVDVLPNGEELFYWDRVQRFFYTRDCRTWMKTHNNIGLSFTSCAIRRRVWEENPLGKIDMSEDKVFQKTIMKKGHRIFFQRNAKDYHFHRYTVKSLAKRCENEGLGWRLAGQNYSLSDMVMDMLKPEILYLLISGIMKFKIRYMSEFLFPFIRPAFIFKGNHFTKQYVK